MKANDNLMLHERLRFRTRYFEYLSKEQSNELRNELLSHYVQIPRYVDGTPVHDKDFGDHAFFEVFLDGS